MNRNHATNEEPTSLLIWLRDRVSLDIWFVLIITTLSILFFVHSHYRLIVLNAYFVPIVLSGLLLGWLRASSLALLGFSLVFATVLWDWEGLDARTLSLVFAWGATLGTTGGIVGLLFSSRESTLIKRINHQTSNALTDPLTGIRNRRSFDIEISRQLSEFRRHSHDFSVLMVDVDRFKGINDRYGHGVGDLVLKAVATSIDNSIRDIDLLARFGGEEFAVILPNTAISDATIAAERIRKGVESFSVSANDVEISVTVSVGVASAVEGDDAASVTARSDSGLYQAKNAGRNKIAAIGYEQPYEDSHAKPNRLRHRNAQTIGRLSDSLIGLPLKEVFLEELRRRIDESLRYGCDLTLAICKLNSERPEEDELRAIGIHLSNSLRSSDMVCWFEENQFAVMLPHTDSLAAAKAVGRALSVVMSVRCSILTSEVRSGDTVGSFCERVLREADSESSDSLKNLQTDAIVSDFNCATRQSSKVASKPTNA